MIKIGVVGVQDGWSSQKLVETVYQKTGYRLLIEMKKICLDFAAKTAWYNDTDLLTLDALIIKKMGASYSPNLLDRLEMLRYLHERGLKIYSNPLRILRVIDRMSCTTTLQSAGIPMPPTTVTENVDKALQAVHLYGEAVFKPLFSTKAKGMVVIQADEHARKKIETFQERHMMMYIQKKVNLPGKDMGIVFLGGAYLTTYARVKTNASWNTTTRSGGKYQACEPSEEIIALAKKAQDLFDLDFTCVDVAETDDGPIVFEVSAFGGFKGVLNASGIDAADRYVDYVMKGVGQ